MGGRNSSTSTLSGSLRHVAPVDQAFEGHNAADDEGDIEAELIDEETASRQWKDGVMVDNALSGSCMKKGV
jgi:hypothetical protein